MTHVLAKIFGWAQFGLVFASQAISAQGMPHGAGGWLTILGSGLAAAAIHQASSTDGTK